MVVGSSVGSGVGSLPGGGDGSGMVVGCLDGVISEAGGAGSVGAEAGVGWVGGAGAGEESVKMPGVHSSSVSDSSSYISDGSGSGGRRYFLSNVGIIVDAESCEAGETGGGLVAAGSEDGSRDGAGNSGCGEII